jgi:hypothetical protein
MLDNTVKNIGPLFQYSSGEVSNEEQNMIAKPNAPRVGEKAPEFLFETSNGSLSLHQLAARHKKLILTTQDSYRYHPN